MSSVIGMLYIFLVTSVLRCLAEKLDFHTFEPPFNEVDHAGTRMVSRHWRPSGTTVVQNNFVRLTPDRQSKKGALWSRKSLGVPTFSCILKFRISGQGKNFFGDGMALWIVQQGYYSEGTLHGFQEKFVGIGIIFDTFKNTENLSAHRDVTVLINDGEKTYEMMTEEVKGCNINVRYHADRADFSVSDASRAKIIFSQSNVTIQVDAKNSGDWTECVNFSTLPLPEDWLKKAHIGITATTGQLADNHDVLSLMSFSDFEVMESTELVLAGKKSFPSAPELPQSDRITRLEEETNKVLSRFDVLDHHLEHELASVQDHIDTLIGKLGSREDKAETRIDELEQLVKKEVDGSLSFRLNKLEKAIRDDVNRKISRIEAALERVKITVDTSNSPDAAKPHVSSGDWKLPFFFLLLLFIGGMVALYFAYRHLLNKDKLP